MTASCPNIGRRGEVARKLTLPANLLEVAIAANERAFRFSEAKCPPYQCTMSTGLLSQAAVEI